MCDILTEKDQTLLLTQPYEVARAKSLQSESIPIEVADQRVRNERRMGYWSIGNGICEMVYNKTECCFDGGDCILGLTCPSCPLPITSRFGDTVCDEKYNSKECCFDDGDCKIGQICPTCPRDLDKINDGNCDNVLNNAECCFDGGDCLGIAATEIESCDGDESKIGDLICDVDLDNSACQNDGGDCHEKLALQCSSCLAENVVSRLGDGNCDEDMNNFLCCYDLGDCSPLEDCKTCQSFLQPLQWTYINDGICDKFNYFEDCCFDGEDCLDKTDYVLCRTCPDYIKRHSFNPLISAHGMPISEPLKYWFVKMLEGQSNGRLGDGKCHASLNNEECCFDGGDCLLCPTCQSANAGMVNDGICDPDLMTEECCFDLGDCTEEQLFFQTCIQDCYVPGLTADQVKHFLTNQICDAPLNKSECCFDSFACVSSNYVCDSCPYNTTKYGDGVCDPFLNIDMCCYDGGDCPFTIYYEDPPLECEPLNCDHSKVGDGICDKTSESNICCQDQLDCVQTRQVWDNLTCSTMSTFTLFDTCPRCCQATNVTNDILYSFCREERLTPECCFDNCLEHLSACPTCQVKDYLLWINDGICDNFLNNADCCFDHEDCLVYNSNKYPTRLAYLYGDIQRNYLRYAHQDKMSITINGLIQDQACTRSFDDCLYSGVLMDTDYFKRIVKSVCSKAYFDNCPYDPARIGDHICDPEISVQKGCCYDSGDCHILDAAQNPIDKCPSCPAHLKINIQDGICQEELKTEECCFDLGDCTKAPNCTLDFVLEHITVGDVHSDNRDFISGLLETFQGSLTDLLDQDLGDGVCNQALNHAECYYDGWDCKLSACQTCNLPIYMGESQRLGNGICDAAYNTLACCYDLGDCIQEVVDCVSCTSPYKEYVGDGICQLDLNNEECCFDDGDCSICPTCDPQKSLKIGDYSCDEDLNTMQCCYDANDCQEIAWESQVMDVAHILYGNQTLPIAADTLNFR